MNLHFTLPNIPSTNFSSNSMSLSLGNITKKMSSMKGVLTTSLQSTNNSDLNKKDFEDIKNCQVDKTLRKIQSSILQSPLTHLGFIVAFSESSLSPLIQNSISFKWFKASEEGVTLLHSSSRPWYAPTVDDLNHKILVQIKDTIGEGLSKYLEVRFVYIIHEISLNCYFITQTTINEVDPSLIGSVKKFIDDQKFSVSSNF
jgi:hypothetical protein